ncbi:hypothetical protein, partial [Herbaspirillum lusitanum]|uniref:hypothetical protein n=1 Tax=Herbaspirillum lusitanum TaxID=213312 RepID=UPI001EE66183
PPAIKQPPLKKKKNPVPGEPAPGKLVTPPKNLTAGDMVSDLAMAPEEERLHAPEPIGMRVT